MFRLGPTGLLYVPKSVRNAVDGGVGEELSASDALGLRFPSPELVSSAGRVHMYLLTTGERGPGAVSIELSTAVAWQLQFSGGTSQTFLNLSNGQVAGIDFTAGSSRGAQ